MEIRLNEENHEYTVKGERFPGVTSILQGAGIIDPRWFDDEAVIRGQYVHKAIELYHTVGLNFNSLDSVIRPYVEAYLDFIKTTRFRPLYVEKKVADPVYKYCGRLDLVGPLNEKMRIIDIKTGAPQNWAPLQLTAYRNALEKTVTINEWIGLSILQLKSNGKWTMKNYKAVNCLPVFLAALTVYNFKNGRI